MNSGSDWNFSVPAAWVRLRWIKEELSSKAVKCDHHTGKAETLSVNTMAMAGIASPPPRYLTPSYLAIACLAFPLYNL